MNFLTGQKLVAQKEFGKALDIFLNLKEKNDMILFYLGLIYFELNNFNKSIYYYNKFLTKKPNSIIALYNFAFVKQSIGEIEDAKDIYLRLIKLDENKIRPYYGLYTLNPNYLSGSDFERIFFIKNNFKHTLFEKGIINFILSKKEKKNKKYSKEIEYLKISHSLIFNSKKVYNLQSQFYYNQIIGQFYNKLKFSKNDINTSINKKIIPIFIIGLPRSGSTLIDAILSSCSANVRSLGECHVFNMSIFEQVESKIYEKDFNLKNFDFEIDLIQLNESILRRYDQFNFTNEKKNLIIIDKSLENFFNIEFILNIFPKAKFIHTFRNPLDSIISIYQSMLAELSWTHSIEDILIYLDNYFKVLRYYKNKYPQVIMDVDLEKFTENSENISKKIYKFCNLNWNRKVLNFHERKDLFSKTLSFMQVRNKISKYDNTKYKPYLHLLKNYKEKYKWINFD